MYNIYETSKRGNGFYIHWPTFTIQDPAVEEALLDSIDPRYYDEKFDSSLFELEKLADGVPPELVNINRQVLEKQLAVVTNKVRSCRVLNPGYSF